MPDIVVARAFTLTHDHTNATDDHPAGSRQDFGLGHHRDVPEAVATNWFVVAHLAPDGKVPAPVVSAAPTAAEHAALRARVEEAERRVAVAEDGARSEIVRLEGELAAANAKVAALTTDLEKVTAPKAKDAQGK